MTTVSGLYSFLLVFVVSMWSKVAAISLSKTFAKPTCDPREPCRVKSFGLEFCTCPSNQRCPSENTLMYRDVEYQFCQPAHFHQCAEGEIAWVKKGFRQFIYCTCPEPFRVNSEIWDPMTDTTQYKCVQQRICKTEETCAVRNRVFLGEKSVSLLKNMCVCPDALTCQETGKTIKNRSIELEQDIFKCQIETS